MKPASPVVPGLVLTERTFAKDQPEYAPLPSVVLPDGVVLTRWRCSFWERLRILFTGNVYLWVATYGEPLQPVMLDVERPSLDELFGGAK